MSFSYDPSTGVVGWKAWYDGDRFFTSATTAWAALPALGVLVIMLYFAGGLRRVMAGTEYYVLDGSAYNHEPTLPTSGAVKQAPAELIPEAEFNVIYSTAMADFTAP